MLVLTRKLNESIQIDDNIIITVTKIEGNKVKLGIIAPIDKNVVRKEVLDKKDDSSLEDV